MSGENRKMSKTNYSDRSCKNCRYSKESYDSEVFYCVRYPPTKLTKLKVKDSSTYHRVLHDNYCGEFAAKPKGNFILELLRK